MKLIKARVQNFKSIEDSGWVETAEITCLVGKNESGKTAFLQALARLNPVEGQPSDFDHITEFPRQRSNRYKAVHDEEPAEVVSAMFELDDDDVGELPGVLADALASRQVTITRSYNNRSTWTVHLDQSRVVAGLLAGAELPEGTATELHEAHYVSTLRTRLQAIGQEPPQAATLLARIDAWRGSSPSLATIDALAHRVPRFFYFDDYAVMKGRISVPDLKAKRDRGLLEDADKTFLALLRFVGTNLEEFESQSNYERLKADLEAASNEISDELFEFWTQNRNLAVEFNLSAPDPDALPPLNQGTNLHVRIRNNRHRVSVPFDQRSRGRVVLLVSRLLLRARPEQGPVAHLAAR
jgi:energy-coupling factor transporter ATP-binding protein EcfA2